MGNLFSLNAVNAFQVEVHKYCFVAGFRNDQTRKFAFRVEILGIEICIYSQEAAACPGVAEEERLAL